TSGPSRSARYLLHCTTTWASVRPRRFPIRPAGPSTWLTASRCANWCKWRQAGSELQGAVQGTAPFFCEERGNVMNGLARRLGMIVLCISPVVAIAGPQQPPDNKKPTLEGLWLGQLDAGIVKLRLVLEIKKDDQGKFKGVMEVPEQGNQSVPMDDITVK